MSTTTRAAKIEKRETPRIHLDEYPMPVSIPDPAEKQAKQKCKGRTFTTLMSARQHFIRTTSPPNPRGPQFLLKTKKSRHTATFTRLPPLPPLSLAHSDPYPPKKSTLNTHLPATGSGRTEPALSSTTRAPHSRPTQYACTHTRPGLEHPCAPSNAHSPGQRANKGAMQRSAAQCSAVYERGAGEGQRSRSPAVQRNVTKRSESSQPLLASFDLRARHATTRGDERKRKYKKAPLGPEVPSAGPPHVILGRGARRRNGEDPALPRLHGTVSRVLVVGFGTSL